MDIHDSNVFQKSLHVNKFQKYFNQFLSYNIDIEVIHDKKLWLIKFKVALSLILTQNVSEIKSIMLVCNHQYLYSIKQRQKFVWIQRASSKYQATRHSLILFEDKHRKTTNLSLVKTSWGQEILIVTIIINIFSERVRKNLKQPLCPVWSPMQGSIP